MSSRRLPVLLVALLASPALAQEFTTLPGHDKAVRWLAYAPDGKTLASASMDHTIKLWDTLTAKETGVLKGHKQSVRSVVFAPDGKTLASGGYDLTIRLWNTGKVLEQKGGK
jgi:WD40 repeat protein